MSEPHKKIKGEKGGSKSGLDFEKIYQDLIASSQGCDDHPYDHFNFGTNLLCNTHN